MLSVEHKYGDWDYAIAAGAPEPAGLDLAPERVLHLGGEPSSWAAELTRALDRIAAERPRARVLLIGPRAFAEVAAPASLRLGILSGGGGRWRASLRVDGATLSAPRPTDLDAALRICGAKARLLDRREALGGSAAQVTPDNVSLTGTPNPGSWTSEPFALAIKDLSTPSSTIGTLVVYRSSSNNPGTVQGFSPGSDYWSWSGAAWPASFRITQTGGDADAEKSVGTWTTHSEGPIDQAPTTPSGGVWYNIRRPGSTTIIGFFWKDQISNPSSFRWYGKTAALSGDRFDTSSTGLDFYQRTEAPTIFTGMKMYIPS